MPKMLFILNDPPYSTERDYNALRLAGAVSKREGEEATSSSVMAHRTRDAKRH